MAAAAGASPVLSKGFQLLKSLMVLAPSDPEEEAAAAVRTPNETPVGFSGCGVSMGSLKSNRGVHWAP